MREKLLIRIARFAERRTWWMLGGALLITLIAAVLMTHLKLEMHFKNLMPQTHPVVQEFNQIIEDYSSASMIIVAARGEEQQLKQFTEALVPRIQEMTQYIQRVDYKIERDFFLQHGFMLQKVKDLKNSKQLYQDLNLLPWLKHLNDNLEKTYVYEEESISTKEKENNAVAFLDGIQYWLSTLVDYTDGKKPQKPQQAQAAAERLLLGDEYFISQDKDMLLLLAHPTFTVNELDKVIAAEDSIDALISQVAREYPGIFAGTTGTMALARDETVAASEDAYFTSILAFFLIILLFIASFRMWVAPILAGISLIFGIIWTGGFAAISLGSLNIMTSMFAVILMGLGVDFSIHIISGYTESRASGGSIDEALRNTLLKSGNGIMLGAVSTACAFFTMTLSESAGMKEFGILAGSGVLFCMVSALTVLPALLCLRDRILINIHQEKYIARSTAFPFLGSIGQGISKKPLPFLIGSLLITLILLYAALKITFDYNYLNMEPLGLTSIKLQHEMEAEFDVTPDFALLTTASVEEARRVTQKAKDLKMIGMVSSISEYLPSSEQQQKRRPHIKEIRRFLQNNRSLKPLTVNQIKPLLQELKRLKYNVIELSQLAFLGGQDKVDQKCKRIIGDLENSPDRTMIALLTEILTVNPAQGVQQLNLFQQHFEPHFRKLALGMTSTTPLTLDVLPESILKQFINHDRDKFLVTIYPKESVWNLSFLERFTHETQKIDQRFTGLPPVFYILIDIIAEDGLNAAILTLVVIFLLLVLNFRSIKMALITMIPLLIGAVWMVGVMSLLGLKLTMLNVMGIPLILGIGIDDGIHIINRYRLEGKGSIKTVLLSAGKAVLLTSLTTMLAFGSLVFAVYRGLGSMGIALFIGVGTCLLASIIILPALLGWLEKKSPKEPQQKFQHV